MKNIFNIICVALFAISFGACSDDIGNPYAEDATITLVKSDVAFEATASTGTITYTADGAVTATTNADWCMAEVQGNSVVVSVQQNNTINGRTAIVNLSCGKGSIEVAVTQKGVVFQLNKAMITADDNAQTCQYTMNANVDIEPESAPEWATVTKDENGDIVVDFTENTTGHIRHGYAYFRSQDFVDSVKIVQADFKNDIEGTYTLYYKNEYGEEFVDYRVQLRENAQGNYEIYVRSLKLTIPMTFDLETMKITIASGQYCGKASSNCHYYSAFTTYPDADGGLQWSQYLTDLYIYGDVQYGPLTRNAGQTGNYFSIGGYFYESVMVGGIAFREYSKPELSADTDLNEWYTFMFDPYLERVIE